MGCRGWARRAATALAVAMLLGAGPAALAIRQETQLLTSNHQRIRPPREVAVALALGVRRKGRAWIFVSCVTGAEDLDPNAAIDLAARGLRQAGVL